MPPDQTDAKYEGISAVTLLTSDMEQAVDFYRRLGFALRRGGADAAFTTFDVGAASLNLAATAEDVATRWGRVIILVGDVDACYERASRAGLEPESSPRNAAWGERYFHLTDPDGHELSFARPVS